MKFLNKLKTHQKIFLFAILVVSVIALFDILSLKSEIFGNQENYLIGDFNGNWWSLFFNFNIVLIILISLSYYWFTKNHDKSESLSLFIISYVWWIYGGVSDLLFFVFSRIPLPSTLPWLDKNPFLIKVANMLGFSGVTDISLIISVIVSGIILFYLCKFLVKKL